MDQDQYIENLNNQCRVNVGASLKRFRKSRKLSQYNIAGILGITKQAVSRIEKGQCWPSLKNMAVLSMVYGVSISQLIGEIQFEPNLKNTLEQKRVKDIRNEIVLKKGQIESLERELNKIKNNGK